VLDPGDLEAVRRHFDDEAGQALVPLGSVGVRDREDREEVGDRALADEPLRTRDDVVVAVARRPGPDRGDVRARLRFGQRERDELLARGKPRDPAGLLLVRAREQERQRGQFLDRQDQAGRGAGAAQLLHRETDRQQVATETAVLCGERQGEDVLGRQQFTQVLGELARLVDLGGAWGDPFVGEDADGVAEERLLLGQPVCKRRRGGHRGHRSSGDALLSGPRRRPQPRWVTSRFSAARAVTPL